VRLVSGACCAVALAVLVGACAAPSAPSGPAAASTSAGAALAAPPVSERPAVQIPVVVWFEDFNEVLVGRAIIRGFLETRTLDLRSRVRELRCVGKSDLRIVPPDAVPGVRCDGMRGSSLMTCSDGREIISEFWTEETCVSGYSKGIDQDGHTVRAVFGGSRERVETTVREALQDLAWKPAPPPVRLSQLASGHRGLSTGTGFFVSWDGHLVTNFHVIREASRIQVKLDDGNLIDAEVVTTSEEDDLALLRVDAIRTPLPMRRQSALAKGQEVFTLGYPLISLQGQEQKATFGRVNALSGVQGDARFVQIDAPIQPGNSGGPLVNEKGEVVGIVSSMLHPMATLSVAGTLPQNVNYAVKSDLAHEMIRYWLGSDWQEADPPGSLRAFGELIAEIENAVVLIVAE
jgi:S1-C subfamily serine protease